MGQRLGACDFPRDDSDDSKEEPLFPERRVPGSYRDFWEEDPVARVRAEAAEIERRVRAEARRAKRKRTRRRLVVDPTPLRT